MGTTKTLFLETGEEDDDREAGNRRDCTCILELSSGCSVCAGTDDQEDPWNDESRRQRLAEAEYE